jgi:hypothetical protein
MNDPPPSACAARPALRAEVDAALSRALAKEARRSLPVGRRSSPARSRQRSRAWHRWSRKAPSPRGQRCRRRAGGRARRGGRADPAGRRHAPLARRRRDAGGDDGFATPIGHAAPSDPTLVASGGPQARPHPRPPARASRGSSPAIALVLVVVAAAVITVLASGGSSTSTYADRARTRTRASRVPTARSRIASPPSLPPRRARRSPRQPMPPPPPPATRDGA